MEWCAKMGIRFKLVEKYYIYNNSFFFTKINNKKLSYNIK